MTSNDPGPSDPKRWRDSLSAHDELRSALERHAHADDDQALLARVALRLPKPTGGTAATATANTTGAKAAIAGLGAFAFVVAAGLAVLVTSVEPAPTTPTVSVARDEARSAAENAERSGDVDLRLRATDQGRSDPELQAAGGVEQGGFRGEQANERLRRPHRRSVAPQVNRVTAEVESSADARLASTPAGPHPSSADVPSELAMLRAARLHLRDAPLVSLARLAEMESRYPQGALEEEREVLAVRALVELGRRDEALARFARFISRWPDSTHRAALERTISTR